MRTALEELALAVVEDDYADGSDGDTSTFGRAFWYVDIDTGFIATYIDILLSDHGDDDSLSPIISLEKHGMFAVQNSNGIITVTLTDTANEAKALYEDMDSDYDKFMEESIRDSREDTDTINKLRFE